MAGRFRYTTLLVPEKDEEEQLDFTLLITSLNDNFTKVKRSFDTLGMCFGYVVDVADTGSASTDFTVNHDLGVVPDAYQIVYASVPCRIWVGTGTWTASNIFLRCDKANAHVKVQCFVDTN